MNDYRKIPASSIPDCCGVCTEYTMDYEGFNYCRETIKDVPVNGLCDKFSRSLDDEAQ